MVDEVKPVAVAKTVTTPAATLQQYLTDRAGDRLMRHTLVTKGVTAKGEVTVAVCEYGKTDGQVFKVVGNDLVAE